MSITIVTTENKVCKKLKRLVDIEEGTWFTGLVDYRSGYGNNHIKDVFQADVFYLVPTKKMLIGYYKNGRYSYLGLCGNNCVTDVLVQDFKEVNIELKVI